MLDTGLRHVGIFAEVDGKQDAIATVWNHHYSSQAQANARLISAAPELLEACERAETGISDWLMGKAIHPEAMSYVRGVLADVRAAIQQATGQ